MPLTSHSIELDDIERTRKIARDLEARSQLAAKQGLDALMKMEELGKQERDEARQGRLDAQTTEGLVLQRKRDASTDERAAAAEARAAATHGVTLPALQQTNADEAQRRTDEAKKRGIEIPALEKSKAAEDAERVLAKKREALGAAIAARPEAPGPIDLIQISEDTGLPLDEVRAAIAEDQRARAGVAQKAEKGTADLAHTRAQTAGEYTRAQATKTAAESRATSADGLPKSVLADTSKKRIAIGLVQTRSQNLRKLLSNPNLQKYIGPAENISDWLARKTGTMDRDEAMLRTAIGTAFDAYRVATTGAAAGVAELEMLKERLPQMTDSLQSALGVLDANDVDASGALKYYDDIIASDDVRGAAAPAKLQQMSLADLQKMTPEEREALLLSVEGM